ncbi:MAG TPA: IS630 family transposase [Methanobacterium sp.]|nr:IS630 family transposase [Methanobacterium sp.]
MRGPKSPIEVIIKKSDMLKLSKFAKSYKIAHSMVIRATIILLISIGISITDISRKTGVTRNTVKKWAIRYAEFGIEGLNDMPRKGCPGKFSSEVAIHIIKIACEMPKLRNRSLDKWDCKEIADELVRTGVVDNISSETVRRILNNQKLKPWKHHMWLSEKEKSPRDYEFCKRIREIIDIYFRQLELNECALSIDENTSIQARKRISELKAACPGKPVLCEHEYERKGALNLIAAFDTRTGVVYGKCYARKRQLEFINFLEYLDSQIPKEIIKIHVICDNVSTHKGKKVKKWLEANSRFVFHFTPVHCSWMNQIEQWFGILKRKRLTISHFDSKADLKNKLYSFISQWNEHAHPFKWNEKTRIKLEKFIKKVEENLDSTSSEAA